MGKHRKTIYLSDDTEKALSEEMGRRIAKGTSPHGVLSEIVEAALREYLMKEGKK